MAYNAPGPMPATNEPTGPETWQGHGKVKPGNDQLAGWTPGQSAAQIAHRFGRLAVTAQIAHIRTSPHKFFCPMLHLDAK
jgi:hypothetical protein